MGINSSQLKVAILTTPQGSLTVSHLLRHLNVVGVIVDHGNPRNTIAARTLWRRGRAWAGRAVRRITGRAGDETDLVRRAIAAERKYLRRLDRIFFGYPCFQTESTQREFLTLDEISRLTDCPFVEVDSVNDDRSAEALRQWAPDLAVIAGGRIVKPHILEIPRLGMLNKHSSLLPRHRGLAAEYWCLYYEDLGALGVTVHFVDAGTDTGPIVLQEPMKFHRGDTPRTLRVKSNLIGREAVVEAVTLIEQTGTRGQRQEEVGATHNVKPTARTDRELHAKLPRLWQQYGRAA